MLRRRYKKRYVLVLSRMELEEISGKFRKKFSELFGEVLFERGKINFLKIGERCILISCRRGFEDKVLSTIACMEGLISLRTFGTIKKCRRVMREWSSKLWGMIEQ